jgi:apolipoprotein D and lipocalin family protein
MKASFRKLTSCLTLVFLSLPAKAEIKTVGQIDFVKFAKTWYQIARNPLIFEYGCVCSRQVLTAKPEGKVGVFNTCNFRTPQGRINQISGAASIIDQNEPGKLAVDFGLPWKGSYWIIALDPDYRYTVVTDRRQNSLYILSETPLMAPELFAKAMSEAQVQVDVSKLKMTQQEGCIYP